MCGGPLTKDQIISLDSQMVRTEPEREQPDRAAALVMGIGVILVCALYIGAIAFFLFSGVK